MIDFLRTPEDERVEAAHRAEIMAEAVKERPLGGYQVGACTGCGARLALWTATQCLRCHEDHEWAQSNAAFWGFVHREAPGRA